MDDEVGARHALLIEVTTASGARALEHWRSRAELVIEEKASPQDVVSMADRDVETLIREAVRRAFPGDGFYGEEFGAEAGRSGFVWAIDPIDGTSPFLAGLPSWCVSIAVRRAEETVAGAVAAPVTGELYEARIGFGARLDGMALRLDPGVTIRAGQTAIGASARTDPAEAAGLVERLMRRGGMFYRNGSGALMLAYVAAGRLIGYYEPHMHAWDCLAGLLLVAEAGGRVLDYPDGRLEGGGRVLAAAPGAFDDLLAVAEGALIGPESGGRRRRSTTGLRAAATRLPGGSL
jgi:myo-inositol-1(or 4)-monophosphatase